MTLDIRKKEHPHGSILMFTLIIMLLLGLMGAAIMLNTRTELNVSANTTQGRAAFSRADMGTGVATLISRVLLSPVLGSVEDLLQSDGGQTVSGRVLTVDNIQSKETDFNPATMLNLAKGRVTPANSGQWGYNEFQSRYAQMGSATGEANDSDVSPHFSLTLRQGGQVAGTAVVTIDPGSGVQKGMTLGGSNYGTSDGTSFRMVLVVSVNGRELKSDSDKSAYSGEEPDDAPHSVLTSMYLESIR